MKPKITVIVTLLCALFASQGMAAQPNCPNANAVINPGNQTVPEATVINGVRVPSNIILDGSNSNPKGAITCQWISLSNPPIALTNPESCVASFTAPDVASIGASFQFRLTITETQTGCTDKSDFKVTVINVVNVETNRPPVASATVTPAAISEGGLVTLDGSASSDPDGNPLIYSWTQISGSPVTLNGAGIATATFTAPNDAYPNGESLKFRLTVSDGTLSNSTDKIVNVVWVNDAPTASLVCPTSVDEGASVTLNGSQSSDPDDGIAEYAWSQLAGLPTADLAGIAVTESSLAFTAPKLTSSLNTMKFNLTVTDSGNLSSSAECDVQVLDVTPPVIIGADSLTREAASASGAYVIFTPTAHDAVDGDVGVECTPASGSLFPIGITTVTCTASDLTDHSASANFTVTVQDTTPPAIESHADVTAEAASAAGAAVAYSSPLTSDAVDGGGTASCLPASGTIFAIGDTTVTCKATDKAGNKALPTQFLVHVVDTTPPVLTLPTPITTEATGPSGASVTYSASALDIVDGSVQVSCSAPSGSTFPLGVVTVTCSAKDAHNNSASGSFTVTVQDTTPPAINTPQNMTVFASSSAGAVVNFSNPTAADVVDGSVPVICSPASGSTFAVGSTTVTCTAADAHGNSAAKGFTVQVVYNWSGFFQPVENLPRTNGVKAGSAVPLKFSLGGNMGSGIFEPGYPRLVSVTIVDGETVETTIDETVTAGASSLVFDPVANQYIYVWKTNKLWAGFAYQLQIKLKDGTIHAANFKFK